MSKLTALTFCLAVPACLAFPAVTRADDLNPDVPASLWQIAEYVKIKATAYPAAPGAEPVSFDLNISIVPPIPLDQIPVPAWKVQFVPFPVVAPYADSYRVWVGKEDGWTLKVARVPDWMGTPLDAKAGTPFLLDPPDGYPLELFPLVDATVLKTPDGASTVTLTKLAEGDRVWMTAVVRKGDKETLKIRQRWKPGDKWWTDYERYRDGRKELTAQAGRADPAAAADPTAARRPGPFQPQRR